MITATLAVILTVFVWHTLAGVPLPATLLPAVINFLLAWAFAAWVFPYDPPE
jgi:hypothetical protein